ncbi:MAG TPA: cysteine--tRNA ligase [bacterium]|nr:cysteine--tRNA ligase [bacterium]
MLKIYNSLTEKKEEFVPINDKSVGIYACGMTVYDKPHIGHARKEVAIDLIVSYLRYSGYKVNYVRNFTDVDDKIIARANERKIGFIELSEENITAFYKAMDALGLARADIEPKATEHIGEIIAMIEKLVAKGFAYPTNDGSVYFAVEKFKGYGKLSGRKIDEMISGTRFEVEESKKNPLDFALWKSSKPDEPKWKSPWGEGRPGWHIECSAMSTKYLGDTFDIHAGGRDLIFPHHENEIAQAECATGKPFVKYWVHNGFLTVEGEKMSKSLHNFITVDDALEQYHAEVLRYFMLSTQYRTPIDFSMSNLKETEKKISYFYGTLKTLNQFAKTAAKVVRNDKATEFINEFKEAMDDDFNSAKVVAAMVGLFKHLNEVLISKKTRPTPEECAGFAEVIKEAGSVLGVLLKDPDKIISEIKEIQLKRYGISRSEIDQLIEKRKNFRAEKNFESADKMRDELLQKGVLIQDTPNGTEWSFN